MRSPPPPYEEGAFGPDAEDEAEVFSEKHAMLNKVEDIEAAHIPPSPTVSEAASGKHAAEYRVAPRTKYMYLGVYFGLNLALTLFNKAILGRFAFPWLLTTIHTSTASIGCALLLWRGHFHLTKLTLRENFILLAFSVLYTVNIAISNVSLEMVSVSFHQIMRSTTPIFTILIYRMWYQRSYALATYLSLIPIVLGVALTTLGDYYFTPVGFFLTTLGVILAALKTVATNRLMTGSLKLHAFELLFRMSPLAAVQSLAYGCLMGEFRGISTWIAEGNLIPTYGGALAGNGLLAFLLNVASLHTNKLAGALTMTICANLKQCLTVILGILMFDTKVGVWSGYGMVITLVGAAVYSKVELEMKAKHTARSTLQMKDDERLSSEEALNKRALI